MKDSNVKKIMITVNGKPIGNGLLIDKVTYAPVSNDKDTYLSGRSRFAGTAIS